MCPVVNCRTREILLDGAQASIFAYQGGHGVHIRPSSSFCRVDRPHLVPGGSRSRPYEGPRRSSTGVGWPGGRPTPVTSPGHRGDNSPSPNATCRRPRLTSCHALALFGLPAPAPEGQRGNEEPQKVLTGAQHTLCRPSAWNRYPAILQPFTMSLWRKACPTQNARHKARRSACPARCSTISHKTPVRGPDEASRIPWA